jgi:hypothetical protein
VRTVRGKPGLFFLKTRRIGAFGFDADSGRHATRNSSGYRGYKSIVHASVSRLSGSRAFNSSTRFAMLSFALIRMIGHARQSTGRAPLPIAGLLRSRSVLCPIYFNLLLIPTTTHEAMVLQERRTAVQCH